MTAFHSMQLQRTQHVLCTQIQMKAWAEGIKGKVAAFKKDTAENVCHF